MTNYPDPNRPSDNDPSQGSDGAQPPQSPQADSPQPPQPPQQPQAPQPQGPYGGQPQQPQQPQAPQPQQPGPYGQQQPQAPNTGQPQRPGPQAPGVQAPQPTYGGPQGPGGTGGPGGPQGPGGPRKPMQQYRPQPPKRGMNGCLLGMLITAIVGGTISVAIVLLLMVGGAASAGGGGYGAGAPVQTVVEKGSSNKKIIIIPVYGIIQSGMGYGSSEQLIQFVRHAAKDKNVVAVVLDMNTPGGEVTATDEVYHELQKLKAREPDLGGKVVTVTCMRSIAASGGYYLAAGTDHIVANRLTFTGSIGVIIKGYNYSGLLQQDWLNIQPEVYSQGANKNILDMGMERDDQEAEIIHALVKETYGEFVDIVCEGRGFEKDEFLADTRMSDSRILSGSQALEYGLVDELGYLEDAISAAKAQSGHPDAQVVRYGAQPTLAGILFGESDEEKMPKSLGDFIAGGNSEILEGRAYFICPLGM